MKTINYKIQFYSPWHCGSGLAAGADVDLLVIKDAQQFPYVPGKTLKGLIKEWAEDINSLHGLVDEGLITETFGKEGNAASANSILQGCAYFTNAELPKDIKAAIDDEEAQDFLYTNIASTAIGNDGIAIDHSLRKVEATVPCELYGSVKNVPDDMYELLTLSLKAIKHIGVNRNRGLGRCDITIQEGGKA